MPGAFMNAGDYVGAQRRRLQMIAAVEEVFRDFDVLICASSMDPASRIEDAAETGRTYPRQARTPFNVTGHPALAMMAGLSRARTAAVGAVRRPLLRGRDGAARCRGVRARHGVAQEAAADRVAWLSSRGALCRRLCDGVCGDGLRRIVRQECSVAAPTR